MVFYFGSVLMLYCLQPSQLFTIFQKQTVPTSNVKYNKLPRRARQLFKDLADVVITAVDDAAPTLSKYELMALGVTRLSLAILRSGLGVYRCSKARRGWYMRHCTATQSRLIERDFAYAVVRMFLAVNGIKPREPPLSVARDQVYRLMDIYQQELSDTTLTVVEQDANAMQLIGFLRCCFVPLHSIHDLELPFKKKAERKSFYRLAPEAA